MLSTIKKHKWIIQWSAFVSLVILFVFIAIYFKEKEWLGNLLQAIGTISGIYLTIIIFLQSNEESDKQFRKQFRKQLEHLQILNSKQIDALQSSTEKQIK